MISDLSSLPFLPNLLNFDTPGVDDDNDVYLETLNIDSKYMDKYEFQNHKVNNCFTFLNFNIRSLNTNFDEISNFLQLSKTQINVAVLTESWVTDCNKDFLNINGFNSFYVT